MHSVEQRILQRVRKHPSGKVFTPRAFRDLGSPAAVKVALHRLAHDGRLRRVARGAYDAPKPHPILGATAPDPMAMARALMQDSGARWQPTGAYAANLLGLSEQVPAKIVLLTDGVPRRVKIGNLTLDFRRAAPRNLLGAGRAAGLAIQALRHLRASGIDRKHIAHLRRRLDRDEKKQLAKLAPMTPAWMRPIVADIAGDA